MKSEAEVLTALREFFQNNERSESKEYLYAALRSAAAKGYLQVARYLLYKRVELNSKDNYHHNALDEAALAKHPEMVKYLVYKGANVNSEVLVRAVKSENLEIIKFIRLRVKNINALETRTGDGGFFDKNYSALMVAVERELVDIVKYLIAEGADPSVRNYEERSAFSIALKNGYTEIIELIIEQLSVSKKNSERAGKLLEEAVSMEEINLAKRIVEKGVVVTSRCVALAVKAGDTEFVKYLVKKGAVLNPVCDNKEIVPLVEAVKAGSLELVKLFVKNGALPHYKDKNNSSSLEYACQNKHLNMLKYFSHSGVKFKSEILVHAVESKDLEIVKYVAGRVDNLNVKRNGICGYYNQKFYWYCTGLMAAVLNNNFEITEYLLKKGADSSIESYGETALSIAETMGNEKIISLLKNNQTGII